MAEYLIQDTTLDAIADAINAKTGGTSAMTPAEMVTEIGSISGVRKATGSFTLLDANGNSPTITHNLGTQKIAVIIYPVSVAPSGGYHLFYAAYLNVPELVDSGVWSLDFTSYHSNKFPNVVSVDPKTDGSHIRDVSRQSSPWTTQNNWWDANNEPTFDSSAALTDDTVRLTQSPRWAAGSYKWVVYALE